MEEQSSIIFTRFLHHAFCAKRNKFFQNCLSKGIIFSVKLDITAVVIQQNSNAWRLYEVSISLKGLTCAPERIDVDD